MKDELLGIYDYREDSREKLKVEKNRRSWWQLFAKRVVNTNLRYLYPFVFPTDVIKGYSMSISGNAKEFESDTSTCLGFNIVREPGSNYMFVSHQLPLASLPVGILFEEHRIKLGTQYLVIAATILRYLSMIRMRDEGVNTNKILNTKTTLWLIGTEARRKRYDNDRMSLTDVSENRQVIDDALSFKHLFSNVIGDNPDRNSDIDLILRLINGGEPEFLKALQPVKKTAKR